MEKTTFFKTLAALACLIWSMSAAAVETTPPVGQISSAEFPGGINSVELNVTARINREANAFASLYRNNEIVCRIPADNVANVYLFEGDNKLYPTAQDPNPAGAIHITFFNPAGIGAAGGSYTVTIDPGFYNENGVDNEALVFNYTVTYPDDAFILGLIPEPNSVCASLNDFQMIFPDGAVITPTLGTSSGSGGSNDGDDESNVTIPNFYLENKITGEILELTPTVEGNIMKLTFTDPNVAPLTTVGTWALTVHELCLKVKTELVTRTFGELRWDYPIVPASAIPSVLPVPGTYKNIQTNLVKTKLANNTVNAYAPFELTLDGPYQYSLATRPYWVQLDKNGKEIEATKKKLQICQYLENDGEYYWETGAAGTVNKYRLWVAFENYSGEKSLNPEPGKYRLVIPKGCYYMTDLGQNAQVSFDYNIIEDDEFQYNINPVKGSVIKELEYVMITFDEGEQINMSQNTYATLTNGITIYSLIGRLTQGLTNEVVFRLTNPITENGEWTFTTPTSGFTVSGRSPVVKTTFTVDNSLEDIVYSINITPTPGSTVKELSEITVDFPGFTQVTMEGLAEEDITLTVGEQTLEISEKYCDENGVFHLILAQPVTEACVVSLVIPRQTFYIFDQEKNQGAYVVEIKANFTVDPTYDPNPGSSVAEILGADAVTVYNAAGVCLLKDAAAAELSTLAPGFYIVNGKKLILTK